MARSLGAQFGTHSHRHGVKGPDWRWGMAVIGLLMITAAAFAVYGSQLLQPQSSDVIVVDGTGVQVESAKPADPLMPQPVNPETVAVEPPNQTPAGDVPFQSQTGAQPAPSSSMPVTAPAAKARSVSLGVESFHVETLPELMAYSRRLGVLIDPESVRFADLTGDGIREAIVPMKSGGSAGDLGVVVYQSRQSGEPEPILVLLAQPGSGAAIFAEIDGTLVETAAFYGPSDPECCPRRLVMTFFRWNGSGLVADRTEIIDLSVPSKFISNAGN